MSTRSHGTTSGAKGWITGRSWCWRPLGELPDPFSIVTREQLEAIAALAPEPEQPQRSNGQSDYSRLYVERYLQERGVRVRGTKRLHGGRMMYLLEECPFDQSHAGHGETAVFQSPDGKTGFQCKHNSCTGRDWQAFKQQIGPPANEHYDRPFSTNGGKPKSSTIVKPHDPNEAHFAALQPRPIEFMTSAQLDAGDFSVNYLVTDVLPEAQGGVVSGLFKTLQTTIGGVDLMMSVATGTPFLGKFAVPEALPAGIISCESGEATLKEIGRRVGRAKGTELRLCDKLLWSFSRPALPDDVSEVEKFITTNGLRALFIDPSYLVFSRIGDSASNVFKMGAALAPITELVQRTKCSIILCNHNRKSRGRDVGRFDPPELQEISMSGYAEWSRFWLLLGPRREWDDQTASHWLWLRCGGSAGHSGLYGLDVVEGRRSDEGGRRWEVTVRTTTDARKDREREADRRKAEQLERREDEARAKLEKALAMFPNGETAKRLKEVAGLNNTSFATTIRQLIQVGKAHACRVLKHTRFEDAYAPGPAPKAPAGTGGTAGTTAGTVPPDGDKDAGGGTGPYVIGPVPPAPPSTQEPRKKKKRQSHHQRRPTRKPKHEATDGA